MLSLVVYGAGGLGREILYYTRQSNEVHGQYLIIRALIQMPSRHRFGNPEAPLR